MLAVNNRLRQHAIVEHQTSLTANDRKVIIIDGPSARLGMPFDWMYPKIPKEFLKKIEPRFREMHLREIEERARLLFNLRYDKEHAIRRIKNNIEWDFELSKVPDFIEEVPKIVERIYGRKPE